jgi:hypothetical protein
MTTETVLRITRSGYREKRKDNVHGMAVNEKHTRGQSIKKGGGGGGVTGRCE